MSKAPTIRLWIMAFIRRVLAGEPFTWTDWEEQPLDGLQEIEHPKRRFLVRWPRHADENPAHAAWMALQWWVNDGDIRARDSDYAEMRKRQLQRMLEHIEAAN